MKLILAQPAVRRFQWELEVLLTNIKQFGNHDVVLLFTRHDDTVPAYLEEKYGVQCFVYGDERHDRMYIPSVRPWLLWRYFSEDPAREHETYLYIDSDIIFREWLDCATLDISGKKVVGSNCDSYIGLDYILSCWRGEQIARKMADICGISFEQMKGIPGIGAQLILSEPRADFWLRAYHDSIRIYRYTTSIDTNLQHWTAEMWAQLWGWVREGYELSMPAELDFCRPTDDVAKWTEVKILHNAGVLDGRELFFKGKYDTSMPFGENFDYVRTDKASRKYVDAIEQVAF